MTLLTRRRLTAGFVIVGLLLFQPAVWADVAGEVVGGFTDLLTGIFAIPMGILQGTMSGPPIVGTVAGALTGTFHALSSTLGGVYRLIRAAVPVAGAAAPYLPFVL